MKRTVAFLLPIIMLFSMSACGTQPTNNAETKTIIDVAGDTVEIPATSIKNLIQAKRYQNPVISILRDIGYADALVSLLTLQTALFTAFGQDNAALIPVMNGITGSVICMAVLVLGIYMIYKT